MTFPKTRCALIGRRKRLLVYQYVTSGRKGGFRDRLACHSGDSAGSRGHGNQRREGNSGTVTSFPVCAAALPDHPKGERGGERGDCPRNSPLAVRPLGARTSRPHWVRGRPVRAAGILPAVRGRQPRIGVGPDPTLLGASGPCSDLSMRKAPDMNGLDTARSIRVLLSV